MLSRRMIVAGALLFLLGLLQGAAVQQFANPRMALSAHLTAVQSGMAIVLVGIAWPHVSLNRRLGLVACLAIVAGMYLLWAGLSLAAVTGASATLPIAGAGFRAPPLAETMVSLLVIASSIGMTLGWSLFLIGLIRRTPEHS